VLVACLVIDYRLWRSYDKFRDIVCLLAREHRTPLCLYFLFSLLIVLLFIVVKLQMPNIKRTPEQVTLWIIATFVSAPLYYYATQAFAIAVYPFIPVSKGGADYTTAGHVRLVLNSTKSILAPTTLPASASKYSRPTSKQSHNDIVANVPLSPDLASRTTGELVLLEETSSWIYLAEETDSNATDWRRGYRDDAQGHPTMVIPNIIKLRHDDVLNIIHLPGSADN